MSDPLDSFLNWYDSSKFGPREGADENAITATRKAAADSFTSETTDKQGTFSAIVLRIETGGSFEPGSMPMKKYRARTKTPPKLVVIKARIPELHAMLPLPSIQTGDSSKDCSDLRKEGDILKKCHHPIIDLYPTFYSINPGVPVPKPGDIVKVKYADLDNYKDPVYLGPEVGDLQMAISDPVSSSSRSFKGGGGHGSGGGIKISTKCKEMYPSLFTEDGTMKTGYSLKGSPRPKAGFKAQIVEGKPCAAAITSKFGRTFGGPLRRRVIKALEAAGHTRSGGHAHGVHAFSVGGMTFYAIITYHGPDAVKKGGRVSETGMAIQWATISG